MEAEAKNKFTTLIELIRTTDDLYILETEVDILLASLFHVDEENFNKTLSSQVRIAIAQEIRHLMQQEGISSGNKQGVKSLLDEISSLLHKLPVIYLTIGFEPSDDTVTTFSSWVRSNIKHTIILDIVINKTLIAGATINYEGKYWDYSFKTAMDKFFGGKSIALSNMMHKLLS